MKMNLILIRECFDLTKPILDQIIHRFYENLFHDFPVSVNLLSPYDLTKQKNTLMNTMITIIDNLDKPKILTKFLIELENKVSKFGVEDFHYDWISQSFLKTFSQFLGRSWSNELNQEWVKVFQFISQIMKQGAEGIMIESENIATQSQQDLNSSNVKIEMPYLTEEFKSGIKSAVKALVLKQIKVEVEKYLKEELNEIARMSPEELISMATHV
ncbi:MAG: hypothetical protein K2X69_07995 [Silvanigrellaceae bacterium]|jgi:hemoglobin-like flavoprotein|nr:hypothetical protein [Silvanigrellaceae bacterium]